MEALITTFIAAYGPALISVITSIATAVGALMAVRRHFKAIENDTTIGELVEKLDTVIGQNDNLRRQNKILMEKITHVK